MTRHHRSSTPSLTADLFPTDGDLFGWDCDGDRAPQASVPYRGAAIGYDDNCFITDGGLIECIGDSQTRIVALSPRCGEVADGLSGADVIAIGDDYARVLTLNKVPSCWGDSSSAVISVGGEPSTCSNRSWPLARASPVASIHSVLFTAGETPRTPFAPDLMPFNTQAVGNTGYTSLALYDHHACANQHFVCRSAGARTEELARLAVTSIGGSYTDGRKCTFNMCAKDSGQLQ